MHAFHAWTEHPAPCFAWCVCVGQLDPNAPRGEGLDFWLNETKKWDDLGIAPKVVRHNVAPLAALCALVLTVVLVAKVAGRLVKSLTLKFLRCLLCGYCLTKRVANPDRNYVPPYTEGACQRAGLAARQVDAILTVIGVRVAVYERELDPRFEHELMDQEVAQGWILNTDTEGRQWVAKQWLTDGTTDGIPHYQGQKKRTWEARGCRRAVQRSMRALTVRVPVRAGDPRQRLGDV